MSIVINNLDYPTTTTLRDGIRLTRFPVEFQCTECSGSAYLCVIHSSPSIDLTAVKRQVLGQPLEYSLGIEKIRDFKKLLADGHERMVPLGPPGAFEFEGCLTSVLFSGEGYFFRVGQVEF